MTKSVFVHGHRRRIKPRLRWIQDKVDKTRFPYSHAGALQAMEHGLKYKHDIEYVWTSSDGSEIVTPHETLESVAPADTMLDLKRADWKNFVEKAKQKWAGMVVASYADVETADLVAEALEREGVEVRVVPGVYVYSPVVTKSAETLGLRLPTGLYDVVRGPYDVPVSPYGRRREPEARFSKSVLQVAVEEAEDILRHQSRVLGYQNEAQAKQVSRSLNRRGIETEVVVEFGEPIRKPRTWQESRAVRDLGLIPGTRYAIWGIRRR